MARMMKSRHHDGVDPNWFHFDCFWPKAKGWGLNAGEIEKIKGVDALRFEDQERVEKACNAITDIRKSFKLFFTQIDYFTAKFVFFGPGTVYFGRWISFGKSWNSSINFSKMSVFRGVSWIDFWKIHPSIFCEYSVVVKYRSVPRPGISFSNIFEYHFRLNALFWMSFLEIGLASCPGNLPIRVNDNIPWHSSKS